VKKSQILLVCGIATALALPFVAGAGIGPVVTLRSASFSDDAMVRDAVRTECSLDTTVPRWIAAAAQGRVATVDSLPQEGGNVLNIQITDAAESGNAFAGRHKSLTIRGELRDGDKVVGTFRARRSTNGGMWGGYKGNCSFFHRCAKTLGQDVARWLNNPTMNAVLGD
jgi:hypothetical protein